MNHDSRFYDTLITVDGKVFKTHKYILCKSNSSFFLNLYKNAKKPKKPGEPIILNISYPIKKNIFQLAINILYQNDNVWKSDLSIIHNDCLFELYKTCYLLDIYVKPSIRNSLKFTSNIYTKLKKNIEKYEETNVKYVNFFNPCISEINKRIKDGKVLIKKLYNFLNVNRLIYKCQFNLKNIISQIVEQSKLEFIDQEQKNEYKQKLFKERINYSSFNIPIQQTHIDYIGKLIETH